MRLSVIIPVYNVVPYLRKCVDSLLAQDFADYELILVDDGSTDGSGDICDQIVESQKSKAKRKETSPTIKVIHQPNGGLSAARNSGIAVAQGDYICFVDSDDYWQPNVLGGLMAQIERDRLDVLRFKYQYVRLTNERISELASERVYRIYNPYKADPFRDDDFSDAVTDGVSFLNTRMGTNCYAVMFILRRDLIVPEEISNLQSPISNSKNILFTPEIFFEDTDWTPRMLVRAQRVASTDRIVYNYLLKRQGSITNAPNREKLRKELDDKMHLVGEMQRQADLVRAEGHEDDWFGRMIASLVVSIIGLLSTDFYSERKSYLERLRDLQIYPLPITNHQSPMKLRLINFSPRLAVELLHLKNAI